MFTKNYIRLQNLIFQSTQYNTFDTTFVKIDGTTTRACIGQLGYLGFKRWMALGRCQALTASSNEIGPTAINNALCPGVYFGSGSTPATRDDYTLEAPITSGLTITNGTVAYGGIAGDYYAHALFTVQNTSENEITISEVGLFTPLAYDCSANVSNAHIWNLFLMDRVVLEEPITIPAGGAKVVMYKQAYNQVCL